ncbi:MAG: hypothetical protein WCY15_13230 [Phenylobacterium sp.]|uniref:hypothetical protein n=1 Tax=Phenylobacterium sp. TaxID=1871053 RepID=UPI003563F70C
MSDNIAADAGEGTPPPDFGGLPRVVVEALLGPLPRNQVTGDHPWAGARKWEADLPGEWPRDKTGREYFLRGLVRLLWERGLSNEAALSIRGDLEDGRIGSVVIDERYGDEWPIPAQQWRAAATSAEMYWTGRARVIANAGPRLGKFEGDIYLAVSPLSAAGKGSGEVGTRERNNFLRALLGLAMSAYRYDPAGKRSSAVPEMVEDLKARGLSVSDDTIRRWLNEAVEVVYDPAQDETRQA